MRLSQCVRGRLAGRTPGFRPHSIVDVPEALAACRRYQQQHPILKLFRRRHCRRLDAAMVMEGSRKPALSVCFGDSGDGSGRRSSGGWRLRGPRAVRLRAGIEFCRHGRAGRFDQLDVLEPGRRDHGDWNDRRGQSDCHFPALGARCRPDAFDADGVGHHRQWRQCRRDRHRAGGLFCHAHQRSAVFRDQRQRALWPHYDFGRAMGRDVQPSRRGGGLGQCDSGVRLQDQRHDQRRRRDAGRVFRCRH